MRASRGDVSFAYIFWSPCHAICRSLRSTAKSPDLDVRVDALHGGAHHTPEARGSGAAIAFKEREDIRPQLFLLGQKMVTLTTRALLCLNHSITFQSESSVFSSSVSFWYSPHLTSRVLSVRLGTGLSVAASATFAS
jgi:hypothetical protein